MWVTLVPVTAPPRVPVSVIVVNHPWAMVLLLSHNSYTIDVDILNLQNLDWNKSYFTPLKVMQPTPCSYEQCTYVAVNKSTYYLLIVDK